ncbi:MAG: FtsW/RodA/SpoVE family cell cycle protein [Fusobacteriaceae bacterium]
MDKIESKNIYLERNAIQKEKDNENKKNRKESRKRKILVIVIILSVISIMNIYSASVYNIGMKNRYLNSHIFYFIISSILFFLFSNINYKIYKKNKMNLFLFLASFCVLGSMPLMANLLPRIVPRINGAIGWIRVGSISVQPAEIFKIFFIILISHRLAISEKEGEKNSKLILNNIIIPIIFSILIMLQNDLGTLIHYGTIFLFMIFMSKVAGKWIFIISTIILTGLSSLMGYIYLKGMDELGGSGYKILRIKSFLNGLINNQYDNDKGYQVGQSLIGVGSGKIFGVGYGNGIQKYSYLPEIHTDFIFASFGEEFGFIGVLVIILLFWSLFNLIKNSSSDCDNFFGKYLSIGIAGYIFIQFLINMSVAIGLLPVFGIPMPIMSFGGSSLITIFISLGIVFNINKTK